ncbi:anoctamin-1-like isoform X3 [Scyliorhinus canicula]|uniref:anoctamin-1-like isoform X3 n=1 Tax=Scyliorhinus canicula TaxID=7830 RepID=UPI0018F6ED2C|nr:anoctamin-1-like isoform X3 [Scyliorhinus canicula]
MGSEKELQVIDYVLVCEKNTVQPYSRQTLDFLREVKGAGLTLDPDPDRQQAETLRNGEMEHDDNKPKEQNQIIKIYAPFEVLSQAAEKMRLKMPLDVQIADTPTTGLSYVLNYLHTDNEENYFSAPYKHDKQTLFKGIENKITFFRPAVRSLIVHHILNHIQMPIENQEERGEPNEETGMCSVQISNTKKGCGKEGGAVKYIPALPYLLMKKEFKAAFTLHEGPEEETIASSAQENGDCENRWSELHKLWAGTYRYQPLWKIRNYFGEKIAFYFAVMQTLFLSLFLPALIGLLIFIYGLYQSISCSNAYSDLNTFLYGQKCSIVCSTPNMTSEVIDEAVDQIRHCDNVAGRRRNIERIINQICATVTQTDCFFQIPSDDVFNVIKSSFDNAATPIFGLIICLWGTIFLEIWKRKNAELVYEWDVENYENDEIVRPEFCGTEPDPITGEPEAFYPARRRQLKAVLSFSVGVIMVGCVFISVLAVVIYKTWARFRVTTRNSFESFLLTTIVSSLLNALSISILGKNNEQFFTSIGLPGLEDNCGELNNCMTELCFQVLTLMITKPLPKFINDVIVPWLKKLMNRFCNGRKKCLSQRNCSKVDENILRDYNKLDLGDFTLEEYTEKAIQYGFQVLFAVSFPLGPLIFFLTIFFDIHVDANRLLSMYKRPIAHMAQDIGHWFTILDLINNIAVVTNGCLIAFTADFGKEKPFHEKLIILIVFEHAVFVCKYLLSSLIPDVPQHIQQAIRRENYEANKKMDAEFTNSL